MTDPAPRTRPPTPLENYYVCLGNLEQLLLAQNLEPMYRSGLLSMWALKAMYWGAIAEGRARLTSGIPLPDTVLE